MYRKTEVSIGDLRIISTVDEQIGMGQQQVFLENPAPAPVPSAPPAVEPLDRRGHKIGKRARNKK